VAIAQPARRVRRVADVRGVLGVEPIELDIVCVLRNGFTAHEQTIAEGGDMGRVIEMRQDFQRLMETKYRETIESITGRKVVAFLSQAHLEPDITLEIFFLDRPMQGAAALDLNLAAD
jgi:uncharacterized protein YbcI